MMQNLYMLEVDGLKPIILENSLAEAQYFMHYKGINLLQKLQPIAQWFIGCRSQNNATI